MRSMNHLENDLSNTQVLLNSDQSLWPETTRANSLDISLLAWKLNLGRHRVFVGGVSGASGVVSSAEGTNGL